MMFHKLIVWFKTEVEHIQSFIKTGSLIAPLIGLYYFLAYLRFLDIPFPADFSVLPSVLSTIGIVTVFMLLVLSVYILMAAWIVAAYLKRTSSAR